MSMPCINCGGNSLSGYCFRCKPRKALKAKRAMKKIGKVTQKWIDTKKNWLGQNKAPYFFCHYCNKMMTRTQLTLDHYKSRGRHPELRYKLDNLVPCCGPCNKAKGSLGGDEYLEIIGKRG